MPVTTFFQVRIFPIPGEEKDGGKKGQAAAVQGGEEDVPMRDRYIVMHQVCALFSCTYAMEMLQHHSYFFTYEIEMQ